MLITAKQSQYTPPHQIKCLSSNQNYSTEIYTSKIANLNNSTQDVTGTFMHQYFNLFDVVKDLRGFQIDILKKP